MGKVDAWKASAVYTDAGAGHLAGLVVTRDGTFVTASQVFGEIKVWRDGKCAATFTGGYFDDKPIYGNSVAVVGGRLLAVGSGNTVLVFE